MHALIAEENFAIDELQDVTQICIKIFKEKSQKSPVELYWVLFLLSCDPNQHEELSKQNVIERCLDTCTYEIFQKSDPRPLVKIGMNWVYVNFFIIIVKWSFTDLFWIFIP